MKFYVQKLNPDQWSTITEGVHLRVFGKIKPKEKDRIDYGLLVIKDGESDPVGYMTCRELSDDSVYWQYGGSFEKIRGTTTSWRAYQAFLDWMRCRYKHISTYVKNDNLAYLKMAMKAGFRVIGTRCFKDGIYLDLYMEVEHGRGTG